MAARQLTGRLSQARSGISLANFISDYEAKTSGPIEPNILRCKSVVRFGLLADIRAATDYVRFTSESGHQATRVQCPLRGATMRKLRQDCLCFGIELHRCAIHRFLERMPNHRAGLEWPVVSPNSPAYAATAALAWKS